MSYDYFNTLSNAEKEAYKAKLKILGLTKCPYQIPGDDWDANIKKLPALQYPDVYHYLIKHPRVFSPEAMENYQSLEAYRYYTSGWVQEVFTYTTRLCTVLRANVRPSYRVTEDHHHPWVAIDKNCSVVAAHCDSMAGLGESCSHVAALMFKIEAGVRLGYTTTVPTDEACLWNQSFTKSVDPAKVANIKFYTEKAKEKIVNSKPLPPAPSQDEKTKFLENLSKVCNCTVGLSSFSTFQHHFISEEPSATIPKVPATLASLYNASYHNLSNEELNRLCLVKLYDLKQTLTDSHVEYVEAVTRHQRLSKQWHEQKLGRITSSMAHQFLHTNPKNAAPSYIQNICYPSNDLQHVPAIKHGIENEDVAFQYYSYLMGGRTRPNITPKGIIIMTNPGPHDNFNLRKAGLFLCKDKPFIGASPDGISECSCCGQGVLEIKCPFKYTGGFKDVIGSKDFYISSDFTLAKNHHYYTQVQLQMVATKCKFEDFIVWTPVDFLCTRIVRDEPFINEMMESLESVWISSVLPELLTRRQEPVQNKRNVPSTSSGQIALKYCLCKTSTDLNNMVGCDSCDDWFHPKCLKLKRLPTSKIWYCPACKKKKSEQ